MQIYNALEFWEFRKFYSDISLTHLTDKLNSFAVRIFNRFLVLAAELIIIIETNIWILDPGPWTPDPGPRGC